MPNFGTGYTRILNKSRAKQTVGQFHYSFNIASSRLRGKNTDAYAQSTEYFEADESIGLRGELQNNERATSNEVKLMGSGNLKLSVSNQEDIDVSNVALKVYSNLESFDHIG